MAYRPTPKTMAKKAAMRSRLIETGRRLFIQQGYDATSLQQIVREADTSIGNCYFYFENKEALLLTIAQEFRQEVEGAIDRAIAPVPPGPGLFAIAVYVGAMTVLQQPELARATLSDTVHPALRPMTMELFASRVERGFQAMPQLLPDWEDAGPRLAALAWHGSANYVLEEAIRGRLTEPAERIARFLARWNLQALGLSPAQVQSGMHAIEKHIEKHIEAPIERDSEKRITPRTEEKAKEEAREETEE